ncbi:unnamed protein product [Euphydryas editha]|uniref:Uncharacterized protein n=1 Tax=Euphydryas editha TaxID=104508 RepID=A0AAU9UIM1_EUPED|nr:unnamed protein product [Euphydryas editha]
MADLSNLVSVFAVGLQCWREHSVSSDTQVATQPPGPYAENKLMKEKEIKGRGADGMGEIVTSEPPAAAGDAAGVTGSGMLAACGKGPDEQG